MGTIGEREEGKKRPVADVGRGGDTNPVLDFGASGRGLVDPRRRRGGMVGETDRAWWKSMMLMMGYGAAGLLIGGGKGGG